MADIKKTVEIIFGGKNELSTAIGSIERDMKTLSTTIGDVSAPFANLSSAIFKADAALVAFVAGAMYKAIASSSEFNKGFGLISTAINASTEDVGKYREAILSYSTASTKGISDINSAIYTAVQAGIKYEDSLKFMAASEQLATANAAGLNTTVDLLTGTMNAYGFKMQDINHINDVYFTSTLIGKQTIDELGASMGQVVGIAASSGVSFEELSAAIATLTAKGMGTENAITGIKSVITSIISPSKEAADAAKALGLNFDISTIKSKGFAGVLSEIMKATGGSEAALVSMFGEIRAMNAIMQLTNDNLDFFNYALNETANSAGSAERAYQKMVMTFSNQMQMVKNIIEVAFITIGSKLEPIFTGIAQETGKIFQAVTVAVSGGAFDPLFKYLEEVGKQLTAKFEQIAKNLPEAMKGLDFTPIIDALKRLGGIFGDVFANLFGNIDLTAVEGLRKLLQGIIDVIAKLIDFSGSIVNGMQPFIKVLGEIAEKAAGADKGMLDWLGTLTGFMTVMHSVNPVLQTTAMTISAIANAPAAWSSLTALGSKLGFLVPIIQTILSLSAMMLVNPVVLAILGISAVSYAGISMGMDAYKESVESTIKVQDAQSKSFAEQTAAMIVQKYTVGELSGAQAELQLKNLSLATGIDTTAVRTGILTKENEKAAEAMKKYAEETKKLNERLDEIPEKKEVMVGVQADGSSIEKVEGLIVQKFADGKPIAITNIGVEPNAKSIEDTKKTIEKEIPAEKKLEIQSQVDIAKIKEQSAIIQGMVEWKAKIDIAQIEAQTTRLKTMFESINETIKSTGAVIQSGFQAIAGMGSSSQSWDIFRLLEREMALREETVRKQGQLIDAEIEEINARTKIMSEGKEFNIKISAEGLAPQLEAFMFEILKAIQIRANAEGMRFLVGLGVTT